MGSATRCGSDYELTQHRRLGRRAGLTADEVARVETGTLDGWGPADTLLLRAVDELHEMRIEAKRLRYALEIVDPLHEGRLAEAIEAVRHVQQVLGEIHDCDVWIGFLPRFLERERRRTHRFMGHTRGYRRIARGLEELLEDRHRERARLHGEFLDFWRRACGDGFWQDLGTVERIREAERSLSLGQAALHYL